MKIAGKTWGVPGAENSYKQFTPKVENNKQPAAGAQVSKPLNKRNTSPQKEINEILSAREKDALKALFGQAELKDQKMYGNSRIKNIKTGLLLDLKG